MLIFFFFKQKTAYEMRISDWSSDVCSSDLEKPHVYVPAGEAPPAELVTEDIEVGDGAEATSGSQVEVHYVGVSWRTRKQFDASWEIGRASCRERVCQYV